MVDHGPHEGADEVDVEAARADVERPVLQVLDDAGEFDREVRDDRSRRVRVQHRPPHGILQTAGVRQQLPTVLPHQSQEIAGGVKPPQAVLEGRDRPERLRDGGGHREAVVEDEGQQFAEESRGRAPVRARGGRGHPAVVLEHDLSDLALHVPQVHPRLHPEEVDDRVGGGE